MVYQPSGEIGWCCANAVVNVPITELVRTRWFDDYGLTVKYSDSKELIKIENRRTRKPYYYI